MPNDEHLSLNINQVLAAPPPIPVDSDSEVSDFSEFEDEPEPVEENRLHPCYDHRYCELDLVEIQAIEMHLEHCNLINYSVVFTGVLKRKVLQNFPTMLHQVQSHSHWHLICDLPVHWALNAHPQMCSMA